MQFAIIGAGMAGLSCADALRDAGHGVALFDKGRGPGGRMSTRRMDTPLGEAAFDHGAQYFTARDDDFLRLVAGWAEAGVAAPWPVAGEGAWVGVPGMNAVVRQMAGQHAVRWVSHISQVQRLDGQWIVHDQEGSHGPFDAVCLAVPAEQAAVILSLHDFAMANIAIRARSQPCWTGMFVFDQPLDDLPAVMRERGAIAWAARNSSKPGRSGPEAWVVQASRCWSQDHLEQAPADVAAMLLAMFADAAGKPLPSPISAQAHRWRYALSAGTGEGALWNGAIMLGVCGDWLLGPRVECAWLSGRMLAGQMLAQHKLAYAPEVHAAKIASIGVLQPEKIAV